MPIKISSNIRTFVEKYAIVGLLLCFLCFVVYTEMRPIGADYDPASSQCGSTVRRYAAAIEHYHAETGTYPESLDDLVPDFMSRHFQCQGFADHRPPVTLFGLRSIFWSFKTPVRPAPSRPTYLVTEKPDGGVVYKLFCAREHSGRHSFSSGTRTFLTASD